MTDISYQNVTTTLLSDIPEVNGDYQIERRIWAPDEVHSHVVYGTVFARFIERIEESWTSTSEDKYELVLDAVSST